MTWIRPFIIIAVIALIGGGCSSGNGTNGEATNIEPGEDETADDTGSSNDDEPPDWAPVIDDHHPLLLIGLDGVKPSYLEPGFAETPNLDRLIEGGVAAASLKPVFPTHTFPNLYSIVTGLYPESHGIVANTVYDPSRDATLRMTDSDEQANPAWWGGEPIWVTAEQQGLRTGTFFWVGSEAPIKGIHPTHYVSYDSRIPHSSRTDEVVRWLTDEEPVDFATLYFAAADGRGHEFGPNSEQVVLAMQGIDRQIGRLIDKLDDAGLWPDINLIVVSDHGMVELDEDKVIFLEDLFDSWAADIITWTPVTGLRPHEGRADEIYDDLKSAEADHPFAVYRREDVPPRLRYSDNERIPEILIIAEPPYTLTTRSFYAQRGITAGTHGYDPKYPEMHGVFLAHGPDLPVGRTTDTLELVDIYALMAHLLGVEPAEHEGSLERIGSALFID